MPVNMTGARTLSLGRDNDNHADSRNHSIRIVANGGDDALTAELDAGKNVEGNGTASVSESHVIVTREAFDKLLHLAQTAAADFHVETWPLIRPAVGPGKRDAEGRQGASEQFARRLYRFRRLRTNYFDSELFSEPAWDILLDLYLNQVAGRKVCVSSCCIAAATPATTGLRWLKVLEGLGLVVRSSDPEDARRVYVNLSRESFERMGSLLRDGRRLLEPPAPTAK